MGRRRRGGAFRKTALCGEPVSWLKFGNFLKFFWGSLVTPMPDWLFRRAQGLAGADEGPGLAHTHIGTLVLSS